MKPAGEQDGEGLELGIKVRIDADSLTGMSIRRAAWAGTAVTPQASTSLATYAACARVPSDTGVKPCSPQPVEPGILFPRDPATSASPDCFNFQETHLDTFRIVNDLSKRFADSRCFGPYAGQSSSLEVRDVMPASL